MIKLELTVTPEQLTAIALVLSGTLPSMAQLDTETNTVTPVDTGINLKPDEVGVLPAEALKNAVVNPAEALKQAAVAPLPEASTNSIDTGELDSKGLPWDARIHGKARNKNKDGSWRYTQGIDRKVYIPQVEAELRAAMEAKPAVPVESLFPTPTPTVHETVIDAGEAFGSPGDGHAHQTNASLTPSSVVNSELVNTPAPAVETPQTFADLLPLVTAAKAAGTLTDETITEVIGAMGLQNFGLLSTRPDLIPGAAMALGLTCL